MLSQQIRTMILDARAIAFTGTRRVEHPSLYAAIQDVAAALCPLSQTALVGDCSGVDRVVRRALPAARVVHAVGTKPFHLVQRSVRLVDELRQHPGALLVGFPWRSAPDGLRPHRDAGRCFMGFGSGTWSTIAYAAGNAVTVAVWLPEPFEHSELWPGCRRLGEWLILQPSERLALSA